jgi:hypothetical protein
MPVCFDGKVLHGSFLAISSKPAYAECGPADDKSASSDRVSAASAICMQKSLRETVDIEAAVA